MFVLARPQGGACTKQAIRMRLTRGHDSTAALLGLTTAGAPGQAVEAPCSRLPTAGHNHIGRIVTGP